MNQHLPIKDWRIQGWFLFASSSVAACLICLGCGAGMEIAPAGGLVQHNGTPLAGGKVLFSPMDRQKPAMGQIEPDGTFVLSTSNAGDGTAPGRYRVGVISELKFRGRNVKVDCTAPKDFFLTVQSNQENDFVINIRAEDGWKLVEDD